jgi:hypothetical protein
MSGEYTEEQLAESYMMACVRKNICPECGVKLDSEPRFQWLGYYCNAYDIKICLCGFKYDSREEGNYGGIN